MAGYTAMKKYCGKVQPPE